MTREAFEVLLTETVEQLGREVRTNTQYHGPAEFQKRVFEVLKSLSDGKGVEVSPSFHPHAFPDIIANGFGVEVKTTNKDSWLSVGNSVFEGMRDPSVSQLYVVFGKMGGMASVMWGRYEDRITHVRISHAPRFVLEMDRDSSLFDKMGVSYEDFSKLAAGEKMRHVRQYARSRLSEGERLWWLEDEGNQGLPLKITLYMRLPPAEKLKLRAEGAILFPEIVGGGRVKDKYNDVAFYFLKYHNVFCPQTRDLFSAGSVAGKERGGNYLMRSLQNMGEAMRAAALQLDDALFVEYWGTSVKPNERIKAWLARADAHAKKWKPSEHLFLGVKK